MSLSKALARRRGMNLLFRVRAARTERNLGHFRRLSPSGFVNVRERRAEAKKGAGEGLTR
jgi:hypothetical protein